jgi:sulfur-oxidizing protein SoxX
MRKPARNTLAATGALALIMGSLAMATQTVSAAEEMKAEKTPVEQGKEIAFNKKKGNCLACHKIEGGSLPGNIGPALVNMQARYPDKQKLRDQIFDATKANPNTIMPPFGKHKIISDDELNKVVEYIHTL